MFPPNNASTSGFQDPADPCAGSRGELAATPADENARTPASMAEATTRSSLLDGDDHAARQNYYRGPVRDYLRRMGCPAQDLDILADDVLTRLQTNILLGYDRSGPFRPYFKQAIRTWFIGRQRRMGRIDAPMPTLPDDPALLDEALDEGLIDYARQGYHIFAEEADASLRTGIAMLEAWVIDDIEQPVLARHWKLTDRQVRTWLGRAADQLAAWMHGHLHPDDLRYLADHAREHQRRLELDRPGLRRLFSHLSQQKRANALFILSLIVRRDVPAGGKPPPS